MELYLHHGRRSPDEKLDDWGPQGPRLRGVKGIHQTYGNRANVFFETPAAFEEARRLTGWDAWEEGVSLTMSWVEDYVVAPGPDGKPMYFGDWGITPDSPPPDYLGNLTPGAKERWTGAG